MTEGRGSAPDAPAIVDPVIAWFAQARRPLPWRAPGVTAWGILVSEFMLQQTQVDRVIPRWQDWMERWPAPEDLAAAPVSDALRLWDRLGYPRRAKWLHACAVTIRDRHDGMVPADEAALLALPGVGHYTAAAVRAFAYGLPGVVLDTNVRRVIVRAVAGEGAVAAHVTADERTRAAALADHPQSSTWSAAVMELGALVCTASRPACHACPIEAACAWRAAGYPAAPAPRRQARFEGSDRQVRGRIMALVRGSARSVPTSVIETAWPDAEQRDRALASLLADGLIEVTRAGRVRLPR
ncbi:MAG: A/G-specific adenine glycosylase [Actinomycetales bacterium]|nr:A/G-specific adenine glycosylase [Actinomycetales bacterium]